MLSISEVNFIVDCSACRRKKLTFAISSPDEFLVVNCVTSLLEQSTVQQCLVMGS